MYPTGRTMSKGMMTFLDGDSVGSGSLSLVVTTDTCKNMCSPHRQDQSQNQQSPKRRVKADDVCFRCGKQGHWANECPTKPTTPKKLESPPSATSPQPVRGDDGLLYLPSLLCPCGAGVCALRTSNTLKNPGRKFYCCPINGESNCNFFKWHDKVESDDFTNVPICGCGAGPCRLSTETTGSFAGRKFFSCPIKKGQGACDFFRWQVIQAMTTTSGQVDESINSPQSTLFNYDDSSPVDIDLVEGCCLNHGEAETESPRPDSFQHPQKFGMISGLIRVSVLPQELEGQEGSSGEPLRKHHKRLRDGAEKFDGSILDSTINCLDMPQPRSKNPSRKDLHASVLEFGAKIHCRQVEFWRQISLAGTDMAGSSASVCCYLSALPAAPLALREKNSVTSEILEDLAVQLKGWWGRLAFPPSRCLIIPSPKPFYCCVYPSFDPIPGPEILDMLGVDDSAITPNNRLVAKHNRQPVVSPGENAWQLCVVPGKQSCLEKIARGGRGSVMDGFVSDAFRQAAVCLQNDLLSLLETIDIHDHKCMEQEASTTFAALDRLLVDCQPFCDQVREFIGCSTSLAEIDMSACNNCATQVLVDRCILDKTRLDGLSRDHAEAAAALDASRERLKMLQGEASRVKNMLCEIESDLSYCEAEVAALEARIPHLYVEMEAAEHSFGLASKEAEEAAKLSERKEELQNAAKAAYAKARLLLGQ